MKKENINDFRSEIFKLCNEIKKNDSLHIIQETLEKLFMCENIEEKIPSNIFFHQIAKHGNNQFYGYLFANENFDMYKDIFPMAKSPIKEDIKVFEKAHATIYTLIKLCTEDMRKNYPKIAKVLDPYSKYKQISPIKENGYLNKNLYKNAVDSFKNSDLYKKVKNSAVNMFIEKIDQIEIQKMFMSLEKEMDRCPLDKVPNCAKIILKKRPIDFEKSELLIAHFLMLFALRKSLENACSLLFTALVGEELIVFSEDNIISIDKNYKNVINKVIQVTLLGCFSKKYSNIAGEIALIHCNPNQDYNIHEFGIIHTCTSSFNQETGETSNMTLQVVDNLLNPYFILMDSIDYKN